MPAVPDAYDANGYHDVAMGSRETNEANRLPFMPLYIDDWLSSDAIAAFTPEQESAYLRLLMRQWKSPDCSLPKDESILASYSRLGSRWKKLGRQILQRCFVEVNGRFVNQRLKFEWEKAREKSVKAQSAAFTRWSKDSRRRLPVDGVEK
jgi:uncharacterized protein YdaU (DUF1376 family)